MTRTLNQAITLAQLASRFGGQVAGDPATSIRRLASLSSAQPGDLSFLSSARHQSDAAITRASALVVIPALTSGLPDGMSAIVVPDAYAHFARIARWFESETRSAGDKIGVHPTACIAADASIGKQVSIGAYAVIGPRASLGDGVIVGAHCHVDEGVQIGAHTRLYPGVKVLIDCVIGERGIVHSGTVIGSDGFGFAREQGRWEKIPQLGSVRIGNDVEIGANCTIDRGALDDTVISDGCKLDNLIQIAHNVRIGEHTAIAGCVGVAGSAIIGSRCMIGGGAGILGHLEICDDVTVSAMSLVSRSIRSPGFYSGIFPLMPNAGWERAAATLRQLPALRDRIRALERINTGQLGMIGNQSDSAEQDLKE